MIETAVVVLATALGVVSQRVVGFGIAAFLSPVALIFFKPSNAVAVTLLVGTLSCMIVLFDHRHQWAVLWPVVFRLLIAAIPGLLLGAYIVTRIDKGFLQIALGMVVIAGVFIQERAFPKPTQALGITRGISLGGFFAGFLNAAAANGAPAMIIWMRSHTSTPTQIRQNFAALFVFMNLCSLTAIHSLQPQSFNSRTITTFLLLVPIIIVANELGARLTKRVSPQQYEKLVVTLIIVTGLVSIGLGVARHI